MNVLRNKTDPITTGNHLRLVLISFIANESSKVVANTQSFQGFSRIQDAAMNYVTGNMEFFNWLGIFQSSGFLIGSFDQL